MNIQAKESARVAQGQSLCGFCSQPWFGPVAFCPYCGKPSVASTHRRTDKLPQGEKAVAGGPGSFAMPTGELHRREDESLQPSPPSHMESRRKPLPGLPPLGKEPPAGRDSMAPSQMNRTVLALLFTVAAGVGALLFWMLLKLPAPNADGRSTPQLPISSSDRASPKPEPSTPARTDTAAPSRSPPPRTKAPVPPRPLPRRADTAASPPANRSALCSAANEAAGLCKSQ